MTDTKGALDTVSIRAAELARPAKKIRRIRRGSWRASLPLLLVLAVLILMPAGLIIFAAFSVDVPRPGGITWNLTLENFAVLGEATVLSATINSIIIAVLSTILALVIGGFLAFVTARTDIPARRFIYLIGLVPMFLPSYVGALAWSMLGSPASGLLNIAARDLGLPALLNMYSIGGMVFVMGIFYAPYGFLLIHSAMSMMNPEFEDAATVHGGSARRMLRSVTFPLALPAILGAGLLIFVLVFENFPVAQVLASPGNIATLPTYIYRMMSSFPSRGNEAATLAVLLVAFVVLITWIQRRALAGRSYATVSGKGVRARRIALGKMRWPSLALALVYFVAAIVLPLGALLLTAIRKSPYMSSFGALAKPGAFDLGTFGRVFADERFWKSMSNSVVVSISAAAIGTVLAFLIAYVVYRTSARGRGIIEAIAMMPLAIPAIVLGIGLLWTWLIMPIPLYGTLWVMVVAFLAVQMPQGLQSVVASIRATDRDLEDSAVMLGARRHKAITFVTVPLMRVALSASFLLLLMLSMRELTVPLFLYTTNTEILSIAIFDKFENGGALQEAAAISLIYCVIMFVLSYLPRRFGRALND